MIWISFCAQCHYYPLAASRSPYRVVDARAIVHHHERTLGIVPVEAMSFEIPVLACNSGEPTQSIIEIHQ
jgi:hypothetical protein